jgi:Nitrate/nitrite transporter
MKSGHPPTLFAAFLYFDFCFAVWVLNGVMAPFLTESFKLTPAQTGFMISVPILAGALMRFPLGVIAQYIGRKNAAMIEMGLIMVAMAYGFFFVATFGDALAMGVLLGIAGASFGVALSLGSGWFPKEHKGLAMGIAGAGNSGTAIAALTAPVVSPTLRLARCLRLCRDFHAHPVRRDGRVRKGAAGCRGTPERAAARPLPLAG